KTRHLAGDDARRFDELERALRSDSKAVILARGGYGLLRFATRIQPAEKLVIGYSDATVLHEIWRRAGLPSIHGPMCTQLGEDPAALARLKALLQGEDAGAIEWEPDTARGGRAERPLAGGDLAQLARPARLCRSCSAHTTSSTPAQDGSRSAKWREMRIYLLGIAGTGMGSFAGLLRKAGHEVSGSDENVYPPMSDKLRDWGIRYFTPYSASNLNKADIDLA